MQKEIEDKLNQPLVSMEGYFVLDAESLKQIKKEIKQHLGEFKHIDQLCLERIDNLKDLTFIQYLLVK